MMTQRFTLEDAVRVFPEFSVTDLRNNIKRHILNHVGDVPLAGKSREFDLLGMFEIGLAVQFRRDQIPLTKASRLIDELIGRAKIRYGQSGRVDEWIAHEDLRDPIMLLYFPNTSLFVDGRWYDEGAHNATLGGGTGADQLTNIAKGWSDLQPAINRLYHRLCIRMDGTDYNNDLDLAYKTKPQFSIFNVTAAANGIKARIKAAGFNLDK